MSRVGNFFKKLFAPPPAKRDTDKDKVSMMKAIRNTITGGGRSSHYLQRRFKAKGWLKKKKKLNGISKRSRKSNGMRGRKHINGRSYAHA